MANGRRRLVNLERGCSTCGASLCEWSCSWLWDPMLTAFREGSKGPICESAGDGS